LSLQVVRDLRNRVSLRVPLVSGNVFISATEHHRLQDDPVNLLDVICNESNDVADPVIVQSVDDGHLERCFHAGGRNVVQSAKFKFHVVGDSTVTVLLVADPVKLQINAVKSGGSPRPDGKVSLLSEANSIRRYVEPMEAKPSQPSSPGAVGILRR
jgi:hypothetical protein